MESNILPFYSMKRRTTLLQLTLGDLTRQMETTWTGKSSDYLN